MPKIGAPGQMWVRRRIIIQVEGDERGMEVEADCLGPLAIHHGISTMRYESVAGTLTPGIADRREEPDTWTLTSRPTGLRVINLRDRDAVLQIARALLDHARKPLEQPTQGRIIDATPKWIITWLARCREEKRFVDSLPFRPRSTALQ